MSRIDGKIKGKDIMPFIEAIGAIDGDDQIAANVDEILRRLPGENRVGAGPKAIAFSTSQEDLSVQKKTRKENTVKVSYGSGR